VKAILVLAGKIQLLFYNNFIINKLWAMIGSSHKKMQGTKIRNKRVTIKKTGFFGAA